jgi:hypothetical protein
VRIRVRRVLPSLFLAPPITKRKQQSNPPKLTTHPIQSHHSTQGENQGRKLLSQERKLLFACFVAVLVIWMSFASDGRELRGGVLSMLETHIVMSLLISRLVLIFRLALTLVLFLAPSHVLCLAPLLVLRLSLLMDLTIIHMVLVHERTALSLDALVTAHVLVVVTGYRVGLVFPMEGPFTTLSRDI